MRINSNCVDFHSHILPGADHGSSGIRVTKKQIKILKSAGVDKIVATPHFYPQEMTLEDFLEMRSSSVKELQTVLDEASPKIYLGAEVLLCSGLDEMEGLEGLCIEGTNCILLEHPFYDFDENIIKTIVKIKEKGFLPLMAHIDRYDSEIIDAIFAEKLPCQVNAEALCRASSGKKIIKYLEEGRIYALGSDIHGAKTSYARDYKKACKALDNKLDFLIKRSLDLLKGAKPIN